MDGIVVPDALATLIDALGSCGIELVTTRHEMGAGLMAQGVAVATGAPVALDLFRFDDW